jgi:hypothetical protein
MNLSPSAIALTRKGYQRLTPSLGHSLGGEHVATALTGECDSELGPRTSTTDSPLLVRSERDPDAAHGFRNVANAALPSECRVPTVSGCSSHESSLTSTAGSSGNQICGLL